MGLRTALLTLPLLTLTLSFIPGPSRGPSRGPSQSRLGGNENYPPCHPSIPLPPFAPRSPSKALLAASLDASAFPPVKGAKVGVLLLNLGGPETSEDVEGFLYNLFADPDIIRLPPLLSRLQRPIALAISKRRAPKSIEAYNSIGGGSPIVKYTTEQANLICERINQRYDLKVKPYIGMRYWYPFTEQALDEIQEDGVDTLVVLPLYPQFSVSTSGSSLRVLQEEFSRGGGRKPPAHTVVPSWYDRPGYVSSVAGLIKKELATFDDDGPRHVLFSAHGVPRSYIDNGDPYQSQIEDCVSRIGRELPGDVTVHLSYQSRVGPIEWLRPYTDDVLPSLGADGVRNLVVVPISFVSEHIETLEEIDIEYRELAEEAGITNWRRCPALNTDPAFIDDMADLIVESLNSPAQTVTEACVANNCDIDSSLASTLTLSTRDEARLAERWNGRAAMLGVTATLILELISGKSVMHLFGM